MNEPTKHEKTGNGTKPAPTTGPVPADATPKAKAAPIDASEAVRLMLTTLKRVPAEQRAKVLSTLAALA